MTDYKATPEHWAQCEEFSTTTYGATYACLLELRARVEALEANTKQWRTDHLRLANAFASLASDRLSFFGALLPGDEYSQLTPNSLPIRSSLVERLAKAIYGPSNTQEGWRNEARAAIREVAAWMRENKCGYNAVRWLEQEADR